MHTQPQGTASTDNRLYAALPLCTVASQLAGLFAAQKQDHALTSRMVQYLKAALCSIMHFATIIYDVT